MTGMMPATHGDLSGLCVQWLSISLYLGSLPLSAGSMVTCGCPARKDGKADKQVTFHWGLIDSSPCLTPRPCYSFSTSRCRTLGQTQTIAVAISMESHPTIPCLVSYQWRDYLAVMTALPHIVVPATTETGLSVVAAIHRVWRGTGVAVLYAG